MVTSEGREKIRPKERYDACSKCERFRLSIPLIFFRSDVFLFSPMAQWVSADHCRAKGTTVHHGSRSLSPWRCLSHIALEQALPLFFPTSLITTLRLFSVAVNAKITAVLPQAREPLLVCHDLNCVLYHEFCSPNMSKIDAQRKQTTTNLLLGAEVNVEAQECEDVLHILAEIRHALDLQVEFESFAEKQNYFQVR
ncbi:hypothetical protein EJB05_52297, partial [Eragrostis curvula]